MEYIIDLKLVLCMFAVFVYCGECVVDFEHNTHGPLINTNYGLVEGLSQNVSDNKVVHKFFGIPYAKAPVGELRFVKPQKHEGWKGRTLKAIKTRNMCIQPSLEPQYSLTKIPSLRTHEDCLFLNIYVPAVLDSQREGFSFVREPLSVMVFIHGGGFNFGSGAWKDGTTLANAGNVIVVTINYRLGLLGYVSTGDGVIPGNNGYHDQNTALRWVHENIAYFGGEPNNVTIFGESAGAESVLAHVLSPMSAGLFRGAIVHSTSGARFASARNDSKDFFRGQADQYGCSQNASRDIVDCLRQQPASRFTMYNQDLIARVIDGEFMPDSPDNLWRAGTYNHVHLMLGFTSDDGRTIYSQMNVFNPDDTDYLIAAPISIVALEIPYRYLYNPRASTAPENEIYISLIRNKYQITSSNNHTENKKRMLQLMRDGIFASYSHWAAETASSHGDHVHMFYFSHRTDALPQVDEDTVIGAEHGEDTIYAMGDILTAQFNATEAERRLSRDMMEAWSSFAKTTIPTVNGVQLPRFQENNHVHWNWDVPTNLSQAVSGKPVADLFEDKMTFWNDVVVPLVRKCRGEQEYALGADQREYQYKTDLFHMTKDTADAVVIFLLVVCVLLLLTCMSALFYLFSRNKQSLYL